MDKLEEYIRNNREELDKYAPSPQVWQGINRTFRHRKRNLLIWLSAAAMIVVISGTAVLFYVTMNQESSFHSRRDAAYIVVKNNPELVESEIYYNNLINDLYKQATPLLVSNPEIEKELLNDMSQIDSICADIRKDLRDNIDNQDVIEALINNYRIKTRILEDMLEVLRQNENNSDNKNSDAI